MAFQIEEATIDGIHDAMRAGEVTGAALVEAYRERIEAIDRNGPRLNSVLGLNEQAAARAAELDAELERTGEFSGPLHGIPILVKDCVETSDIPTTFGSEALVDYVPERDAVTVRKLREAGAVILGKTTMPDYGMLSSGVSSLHGITRNPWRLDRNPSGSSSGAAAAAVAGYGPFHIGTDIGGSVRLPATHCGIFGLKPSLGRIPIYPPYLGRVAGPMSRSVADAAMLLTVLARPDPRDFSSLPYDERDFASGLEPLPPEGVRIALLPDTGVGLPVEAEVRAAAEAAAAALARAGCTVEPIRSFLTEGMLDGWCRFFEARSYNDLMQLSSSRRGRVLPFITEWCTWRAARFSGADVMRAYGEIMAMREAAVAVSTLYDFVLSPTSPVLPYAAEVAAPSEDPRNALAHIAFTVPYNVSEQPAASINWSYSAEGLPIGIQLAGKRFDDAGVLRMCRLIEEIRPPQRAWPD